MTDPKIVDALKLIKKRKGRLLPADVVSAAREPESPLHDRFEWDDSKAAEEYRLWQARVLITSVRIIGGDEKPVQMFYSLAGDRRQPGGGYREINDIISDDALREELLATAVSEYRAMQERFTRIKDELAEINAAVAKVEERVKAKRKSA